jgi:branched-chain amino acid transport system ATP-binding protein/branched-chain amino acid transport system permease protein
MNDIGARPIRTGGWLPLAAVAVGLAAFPYAFPLIGGTVDLADRILVWGLFGVGFDILFGYTGLLSFGQAAFFGTGGFVSAFLLVTGITGNTVLALLAGMAAGMLLGLVIGVLSLRRTGIYFAMLTLAFGEMAFFLENSPLRRWTGGENGLPGIPKPNLGFAHVAELRSPVAIYAFIAVLFFLGFWLARQIIGSPFGMVLRAIRDNTERAGAVGHDVRRYKLTAFVIAAVYAALAGGLLGLLQGYMPPDAFYLDTSGQLVIQAVIGGAGTLIGPTVGAFVWLYLYQILQTVPVLAGAWKLILGIVFVLLVTLLRQGIVGGIRGAVARRRVAAAASDTDQSTIAPEPVAPRSKADLEAAPIIETRELSKRYGALFAVDGMSFSVAAGETRAVIGPNGAGKSTFFKMLAGAVPPTAGDVYFAGARISGLDDTEVCQLGVARSFQITQIFPRMTVRDNIVIAGLARRRGKFRADMLGRVERVPGLAALVDDTLAAVGLSSRAAEPASELAYGEKRRLEIALALATRPQVLLLDEPTAGMSPAERADTVRLLKRIAAGMTVVIVEHDMDVVFEIADRVTVMAEGRTIAEGDPAAIRRDPTVRQAYLGGETDYELA